MRLVIRARCLDILADRTRLTHRLSDNLALCWCCFTEQHRPADREQDSLITVSTLPQQRVGQPAQQTHLHLYAHCTRLYVVQYTTKTTRRFLWVWSIFQFGLGGTWTYNQNHYSGPFCLYSTQEIKWCKKYKILKGVLECLLFQLRWLSYVRINTKVAAQLNSIRGNHQQQHLILGLGFNVVLGVSLLESLNLVSLQPWTSQVVPEYKHPVQWSQTLKVFNFVTSSKFLLITFPFSLKFSKRRGG